MLAHEVTSTDHRAAGLVSCSPDGLRPSAAGAAVLLGDGTPSPGTGTLRMPLGPAMRRMSPPPCKARQIALTC